MSERPKARPNVAVWAALLGLCGAAGLAQGSGPAAPPSVNPSTNPAVAPPTPVVTPAQAPAPTQAPVSPAAPTSTTSSPTSTEATNTDQSNPDPGSTDSGNTDQPNERSSVSLSRKGKDGKQRQIKIERTGTSDDTGIFAICTPRDDDPAGTPTLFVTSESGAGGIELTVDKNLIRAPLAVVTKKAGSDKDGGEDKEGGDGHIEVSAGSAKYLDNVPEGKTDRLSLCAVEASPKPAPDTVFVTQGRTHLRGQSLIYDESDGIARIAGPISFERDPAAGKPDSDKLTGSSDSIEVNIDQETTTLVGNVVLKNGGRTSKAARVEYDDKANVAILRGSTDAPAESVDDTGTVRALTIRYNLDTGRVTAQGVTGQFEDSGP